MRSSSGAVLILIGGAAFAGTCCIGSWTSTFQSGPRADVGVRLGISEHQ